MHIWQLRWQLQLVSYFTSLFHNLEQPNEPRCELASNLEIAQTSHTWHPEVHKISHFKAQFSPPMIGYLFCLDCATRRFFLTIRTCFSSSCKILGPNTLHSPASLQIMEFDTYDHTTSQTVLSSSFLDNYYYRRSQHTIDSYPNFFHIAGHKFLAYILASD
jgi:hypothetical protein